ncbi:MAG: HEAT repeat domain-containing protein [Chloroflexi bacterium]|nr:MAG: HEAT repeat domain-containing protein [Chloroflexota bacterium]
MGNNQFPDSESLDIPEGMILEVPLDELDDDKAYERPAYTLDEAIAALEGIKGTAKTISAAILYGLSGISRSDIPRIEAAWRALDAEQRNGIIQYMNTASEADFEMDYRAFGLFALTDPEPSVRIAAIELLWEETSPEYIDHLMHLAQFDEEHSVRAEAIKALGSIIYQGELDEIPQETTRPIQELVFNLHTNLDEDLLVRRRALESLANCSHDAVPDLIREAYHSSEAEMRISAIFAMGRTCDDEAWEEPILRELDSNDDEMRYEAARAAGELGLNAAIPALGRLVLEPDRDLQEIAIWALGEIGGNEAVRILSHIAEIADEHNDEELAQSVEDALGIASLSFGEFFAFNLDDEWDDD